MNFIKFRTFPVAASEYWPFRRYLLLQKLIKHDVPHKKTSRDVTEN